jgi:hypothetical protein
MRPFLRFAVAVSALFWASGALAAWKAGDHVQVWNIDWYGATIVRAGTGDYAGYYLIHYDGKTGGGSEQYIRAENIRAVPGAAAVTASAPRPGKYVCMECSGGAGQFRWYLELGNGTYHQTTPDPASGHYSFNRRAKRLNFTSGPYKANNWIGLFSIDLEGKTHKIVLRNRDFEAQGPRAHEYQNIYCTNSTDSPH